MANKKSFWEKIGNKRNLYLALYVAGILAMVEIIQFIVVFFLKVCGLVGDIPHAISLVVSLVLIIFFIYLAYDPKL